MYKGVDRLTMAIIYLVMGVLFTFLAFQSVDDTIWNPLTIVLLLVAALDFVVAYRFLRKSSKKNK